jgi:hypothetical protein
VGFLLVGAMLAGLFGAIVGMGLAMVLSHLVLIWLARAHGVWDRTHDLRFAGIGLGLGGVAVWLHWGAIAALAG